MRDLSTQELGFVYGAGYSPAPPSNKPKAHKAKNSGGKYGKGSGSRGKNGSGKYGKGKCS